MYGLCVLCCASKFIVCLCSVCVLDFCILRGLCGCAMYVFVRDVCVNLVLCVLCDYCVFGFACVCVCVWCMVFV